MNLIKVGGSLGREQGLLGLCRRLGELGREHQLLVVPGGGDFADIVRNYDRRYQLDDATAHWMAILAMDQYGYLLADKIPEASPVRELSEARRVAANGQVPVLLPFDLLHRADPLPHSWEVTSDSIAAWLAVTSRASRLILLKKVDGLFTADPRQEADARLISNMPLDQLENCRGVDSYLSTVLRESKLEAWVLNGTRPERLSRLLRGRPVWGTRIQQRNDSAAGPSFV